jgi:hypothetical protein
LKKVTLAIICSALAAARLRRIPFNDIIALRSKGGEMNFPRILAGALLAMFLLIFFVAVTGTPSLLASKMCSVGEAFFCRQPSLLLIPVLAMLVWGFLAKG